MIYIREFNDNCHTESEETGKAAKIEHLLYLQTDPNRCIKSNVE